MAEGRRDGEVLKPGESRVGLHPGGEELLVHKPHGQQLCCGYGVAVLLGHHDLGSRGLIDHPASRGMVQVGVRHKNPVYADLGADLLDDGEPAPRIEKAVHGVQDQEGITERRPTPVVSMDHMERVRNAGDTDALCNEFVYNHRIVPDVIPKLRGRSRGSKVDLLAYSQKVDIVPICGC